jgi:hypothetical protein
MVWWILFGIAALGAAVVLRRGAQSGKAANSGAIRNDEAVAARRGKGGGEAIDSYRGAMLFPQKDACEAILALRGRTFAEGQVPALPVPGCDRESCGCQIHQVVGRRRGPRRVYADRRGDVRFKEDRRRGRDRREGADTWKQMP